MKKTLLIAAAALVAGAITSQAQVYSANIVGYVNVVCPAGQLVLASNPLDNGTNTANDLLGNLPNKSQIQLWTGTAFQGYTKGSAGFPGNPSIPVGTGFFIKSQGVTVTNTFVGNVVPAPGGNQASVNLPNNTLVLVGSVLPVGGNFNDVGTNTLNLIASLPNKSQVQTWTGTAFTGVTKGSAGFPGNPPITPGQGFFIKSLGASTWVQTLQ